ncbi:UDP-glucose 4-epimerase GalE [Candidatus Sumerlaeota bacterium]|nr:UDP-glucose 4-epimerase GalE [Candidatus Sumerlaeota bacterium]MBI3736583.1 UDP-glucose 4-epimerase GalE [Candidatus Sumerlaeota bacterium]
MNKTILVTGGAGYIGSHTCKLLAKRGYAPVVFDNLVYGHRDFVKWGYLEEGDLLDEARLAGIFERYKPAAVIHFAAYALVGESMTNPEKYYRNNAVGSLNLLKAMTRAEVGRIVFSSTCATYGMPESLPIREDHPQRPINPYGATKLVVEGMLRDFDAAHGMRHAALRYFNAAGADPDGEIGEDHNPETHLIPLVLDVALGRRDQIAVFGGDYDTPDGTCIRDYIHVSDLAEAHLLALERLLGGGDSMQLNLGVGRGYSVKEVIETAEQVTGKKIPASVSPRRAGDPPRLVGDATRARELLNWNAHHPSLKTIIRHAWQWHLKRFGKPK